MTICASCSLLTVRSSISGEMESIYGFTIGERGSTYICITSVSSHPFHACPLMRLNSLGSILGWIANMYQEVLYKSVQSSFVPDVGAETTTRKYVIKKGPEARLCLALVAAILLPAGMLIYAWTARPSIHWIAPLIGLTVSLSSRLRR